MTKIAVVATIPNHKDITVDGEVMYRAAKYGADLWAVHHIVAGYVGMCTLKEMKQFVADKLTWLEE